VLILNFHFLNVNWKYITTAKHTQWYYELNAFIDDSCKDSQNHL
jgi:hypothetical protein